MSSHFDKVRVRFAPSPTGHLHVGSVRAAIFNWLFAKSQGGDFLVRIEDTDLKRSQDHFTESIKQSLAWLEMQPDGDFVMQSHLRDQHVQAAEKLLVKGLAYKCFCSTEELEKLRAKAGIGFRYPQTCRDEENPDLEKPFVVRIKLPKDLRVIKFCDAVRGNLELEASELDDFILLRADGSPTYNLSVVIDDIAMQISHVIRGEDHIINTFRQIMIYQALEASLPTFVHLPLILGSSGERLSKRDCATAVDDYRQQGYLPDALFNYLLRLGWSCGDQEIFSRDEAKKSFSLQNIGKKGAIFDLVKLNWLNQNYLKQLSYQQFLQHLQHAYFALASHFKAAFEPKILQKLFELYQTRAITTVELAQNIVAVSNFQKQYKTGHKTLDFSPVEQKLLDAFIRKAQEQGLSLASDFQALAKKVCVEQGEKIPVLAKALRSGLTGSQAGPGAFALLEIFGFAFFS